MSLGPDRAAPEAPDLIGENDLPDGPLMTLEEVKGFWQSAKQGLGYLAAKIDDKKGLVTGIASSLGALWAALEIYQNPTNVVRYVSHTQLPSIVVDTALVTLGMGITGFPVAATLYGGKAITNQVKGRKRTAKEAKLDEKKPLEQNVPTPNEADVPAADNQNKLFEQNMPTQNEADVPAVPIQNEATSPTEFDNLNIDFQVKLDVPETETDDFMNSEKTFTPSANSCKRRKTKDQPEDKLEEDLVFNTPSIFSPEID